MKIKKAAIGMISLAVVLGVAAFFVTKSFRENRALRKVIERLSAESRIAEVLVTDVKTDPGSGKTLTTIKFLEYDTGLKPLNPKYFTFSGNVIQFQSLVIRFDDLYVKSGDPLKGKSAALFMKVFALTGGGAEVFDINKINEVPSGYETEEAKGDFEKKIWQKFWQYALDPKEAGRMGIKNAQIEAPGTRFVKGIVYTIKIEHDGGMRVDAQPLPNILQGEKLDF